MKTRNISRNQCLNIVVLLILCYTTTMRAQSTAVEAVQPPWIAHASNFMIYGFQVEASKVQQFLPKGVQPKINNGGMVFGGVEMYATDRIYGVPNYHTMFVFIEVESYDSSNGTSGHFNITGYMTPSETCDHFNETFGFSFTSNAVIEIGVEGTVHTGSIQVAGNEIMNIAIAETSKSYTTSEGIVNIVSTHKEQIGVTPVPWMSMGCVGAIRNVQINSSGNKVLEMIKDAAPLWAFVNVDQTFAYTQMIKK